MDIEFLAGLALVANRAAEFVKVRLKNTSLADYAGEAALITALLVGVAIALVGDVNVFAEQVPKLDTLVGVVATGLLIGGGAEVLHVVLDVLYATKNLAKSNSQQ